MAIQGSTDAFPLRGLLSFLGETGRTGRLVVQAKPQVGLLALRDGRVVAAGLGRGEAPPSVLTAPDAAALGEVVVELVTLPAGRFAFHPDGVSGTATGFAIDAVLEVVDRLEVDYGDASPVKAETRIALRVDPAFEAVTVTDEHWEVLTEVGDGASVAELAGRVGLGLPGIRRRIDGLVRLGLAETETETEGDSAPVPDDLDDDSSAAVSGR